MEAGQTIAGKYRLNRLLGTGGMASVWSATNVFTEREFAMKFMLPQVARTPEAARRFLLEAKVSARINHPNIIEVIDVGQAEDGSLFLVMELLTGSSLDVAVRRQKPPMAVHEFILLMRDVAQALAAAHRRGVVHRDLKPTNVFMHKDRDGRIVPKILDFGVSKILEEENNTALTVVGTVLGSPLYMSPEQAMGAEGIDGRTDVFAFGAILFEALSGGRAYDAPNFNALIVTIATTQPRSINEAAPHLPDSLRALVRDCLMTDKTKRIESFERIVERIDAMLAELEKGGLRLSAGRGAEMDSADPAATNRPADVLSARSAPTGSPSPHYGQREEDLASAALAEPTVITPPRETFARQLRKLPPSALALTAGAGGLFLVAMVVGLAAAFTRAGGEPTHAAIDGSGLSAASGFSPAARPAAPVASSAEEPSGVPVIPVDSLPFASRTPAKGNGRLSVFASPGWCSVSVDGVPKGVTPVSFFELPIGAHRLDCVPPSGRPKSATVTVLDGSAAHFKFALDE